MELNNLISFETRVCDVLSQAIGQNGVRCMDDKEIYYRNSLIGEIFYGERISPNSFRVYLKQGTTNIVDIFDCTDITISAVVDKVNKKGIMDLSSDSYDKKMDIEGIHIEISHLTDNIVQTMGVIKTNYSILKDMNEIFSGLSLGDRVAIRKNIKDKIITDENTLNELINERKKLNEKLLEFM